MAFAAFLTALLAGMGVGSGGLFVVFLTVFLDYPQLAAQGLNLYFFIFCHGGGAPSACACAAAAFLAARAGMRRGCGWVRGRRDACAGA